MKRIVLIVSFMFIAGLLFSCGLQKAAEEVAGEVTNHAPVINSITASSQNVSTNESVVITCEATDQDGDSISYSWNATGGNFSTTVGRTTTWIAPSSAQTCVITVTISDGRSTASGSITITAGGVVPNNAPVISRLTASSQNVNVNGTVILTCEATDADVDTISYSWDLTAGRFSSNTGESTTWTAPSSAQTCTIRVTITDGKSIACDSISIQVSSLSDTTAPSAPTGLTAKAGNAAVTLTWKANSESDLQGYNVYRSTTSDSGFSKINSSIITSTTYQDTGLTNNITYYYKITAIDTSSNEGSYSSQVEATPISTDIPSSYSFTWKSSTFNSILDVKVNPTNNLLYMTDQAGDKVYKLNKNDGSTVSYFTENFRAPLYMFFNSAGNLLITDNQHSKIKIFDNSNNLVSSISGVISPTGIAVNSEGKIYVVNDTLGTVSIYSSSGSFISSFGGITTTNEDGKFTRCNWPNYAGDIVIDSEDNVYVADLGRRIIQKFTKDGVFIKSFGSFASNGYLHMGMGIDGSDYIYASDVGAGKIKKYYKDGTYICAFGSSGSGDGQLNIPIGIDVDSNGNVYVGDAGNHRVQCFSPQ